MADCKIRAASRPPARSRSHRRIASNPLATAGERVFAIADLRYAIYAHLDDETRRTCLRLCFIAFEEIVGHLYATVSLGRAGYGDSVYRVQATAPERRQVYANAVRIVKCDFGWSEYDLYATSSFGASTSSMFDLCSPCTELGGRYRYLSMRERTVHSIIGWLRHLFPHVEVMHLSGLRIPTSTSPAGVKVSATVEVETTSSGTPCPVAGRVHFTCDFDAFDPPTSDPIPPFRSPLGWKHKIEATLHVSHYAGVHEPVQQGRANFISLEEATFHSEPAFRYPDPQSVSRVVSTAWPPYITKLVYHTRQSRPEELVAILAHLASSRRRPLDSVVAYFRPDLTPIELGRLMQDTHVVSIPVMDVKICTAPEAVNLALPLTGAFSHFPAFSTLLPRECAPQIRDIVIHYHFEDGYSSPARAMKHVSVVFSERCQGYYCDFTYFGRPMQSGRHTHGHCANVAMALSRSVQGQCGVVVNGADYSKALEAVQRVIGHADSHLAGIDLRYLGIYDADDLKALCCYPDEVIRALLLDLNPMDKARQDNRFPIAFSRVAEDRVEDLVKRARARSEEVLRDQLIVG